MYGGCTDYELLRLIESFKKANRQKKKQYPNGCRNCKWYRRK